MTGIGGAKRSAGHRSVAKPDAVFDRDEAWDALVAFAGGPGPPGPRLGVVSGRLRQGKTYLLEALTKALGGFLFTADEAVEAESLRRLGERLAQHTGRAEAVPLRTWAEAVDALLALGAQEPVPVVIDEFPHLVRQSPALPAALHTAFRRLADRAEDNRTRLLLSGSSHPVMRRLFRGPSPLKGLVELDLEVRPFGFREAARFWGVDDPRLALRVHAVVGGTPAYRRAYVGDRAPGGPEDFDAWVCEAVLEPRKPLFHEAARLVHEETDHWDRALCHSVLEAVALGAATSGEVAGRVSASLADVSHALGVLQDCELLTGEADALRPHLTRLRVTEQLLAFEHAVVRPHRAALEAEENSAAGIWAQARPVFEARVASGQFAEVCRTWVREHTAPDTFGSDRVRVGHGSLPVRDVPDAEVVVRGQGGDGRPGRLLSVGLARWGEVMDLHHLERLRRLLEVLAEHGEDVGRAVPACYSGAGFGPALRTAEAEGAVILVGADRLYRGG
ncbi:ArsR family transcriptional regulator [Streptomyces sp. TRM49041]|uniref:AAA family ATPase n=1 Tax=Streptomyces sp. TRM49041 TaxID=2603216 RepID=UPI0011EFC691|nr:ArsR family transcriptional regulator [Streptomyces sp. TRM49041]